jgi:hypothetical protein
VAATRWRSRSEARRHAGADRGGDEPGTTAIAASAAGWGPLRLARMALLRRATVSPVRQPVGRGAYLPRHGRPPSVRARKCPGHFLESGVAWALERAGCSPTGPGVRPCRRRARRGPRRVAGCRTRGTPTLRGLHGPGRHHTDRGDRHPAIPGLLAVYRSRRWSHPNFRLSTGRHPPLTE